MRRLVLLAALVYALSSCKEEPPPVALAHLSSDVRSHHDWMSDSNRCPSNFVASNETRLHGSDACRHSEHFRSCQFRCELGDGVSCYWLAQGTQEHHAEDRVTEALFQRSCKLGIMSGCTNRAAGMLHVSGRDPVVQHCTASTFEAVCSHGDPWACTMYAAALYRGEGVAKDQAKALTALEKSCTLGADDPACTNGMWLKQQILHPAVSTPAASDIDSAR